MIPKQLYFIWCGSKIPPYVNFAINAFKEVNSNFKVDLIYYTPEQLENYNNINDKILKSVVEDIKNNIIYNRLMPINEKFMLQHICDSYKFKLIEEYGGIYLDCDTFPVRPFDDKLLNLNHFGVFVKRGKAYHKDSFFFGSIKGYHKKKYNLFKTISVYKYGLMKYDPVFQQKRKMFYECKLTEPYFKEPYYIDHYIYNIWLRNKHSKRNLQDTVKII